MINDDLIEQRLREFTRVPIDLYVLQEDIIRMKQGEEGIGYIELDNITNYELVSKHSLQPALQVDDNTYRITFIFK